MLRHYAILITLNSIARKFKRQILLYEFYVSFRILIVLSNLCLHMTLLSVGYTHRNIETLCVHCSRHQTILFILFSSVLEYVAC